MKRTYKKNRTGDIYGFTLIELLVVISITALLMSILIPALSRAREQVKSVMCQSNLKQWSISFDMFASDNNGKFMKGWDGMTITQVDDQWFNALKPYYEDVALRLCPRASKPTSVVNLGSETSVSVATWPSSEFEAWGAFPDPPGWAVNAGDCGSYGINAWVCNPNKGTQIYPTMEQVRWRTNVVQKAYEVPLLFDSLWMEAWPEDTDPAPRYPADAWLQNWAGMGRLCIVRHPGALNMLFLDYHIEKSSLRDLWWYKWHRQYVLDRPPVFPSWMP
jgi:prepilin-type N-terminal cleavage/methylation domain-containing protein/prepilin-type processing-associated H-X9-DG protein